MQMGGSTCWWACMWVGLHVGGRGQIGGYTSLWTCIEIAGSTYVWVDVHAEVYVCVCG